MPKLSTRRVALLFGGCLVLGLGVGLLLAADLGSDGYSTLVNGTARATGVPFVAANMAISVAFVVMAALRGVRPGIGTVVQVVVVGLVAGWAMQIPTPSTLLGQALLLLLAMPVIASGIAGYLGSHSGAGPAEAAALAWDPPVPFMWSYSAVQGGGALLGWWGGATIGVGTIAVIGLLGPMVTLAGRVLHLDVHQDSAEADERPATPGGATGLS